MTQTVTVPVAPATVLDSTAPMQTIEPRDGAACADLLRAAAAAGRAVVPWGAGSQQQLGAPPAGCDLLMSTRHLTGIEFYRPEDLTLGVRAGTTLAEIAATLAAHGQFLPLDAPQPAATAGGLVATAFSPVRRWRYGAVRDLVIGVEVALADGSLCKSGGRVVKNVAGYDLCKLFTGSLGTLGVIVGVNLKVQPRAAVHAAVHGRFERCEDALAAGSAIVQSGLPLGAVVLEGRQETSSWTLLVCAEGFSGAVERQVAMAEQTMAAARGQVTIRRGAEAAEAVVRDLAARRSPPADTGGALVRAAAPPARLTMALEALCQRLEAAYRIAYLQVDVPLGICFIELHPPAPAVDDRGTAALLDARTYLRGLGGHLVLEAAPASLRRAIDPWGAPAAGEGLARRIKQQLDPAGILNPGRFAYGI